MRKAHNDISRKSSASLAFGCALPMSLSADLNFFYKLMVDLESRIGKRRLGECHGRMRWAERGVYFFFEQGEVRGTTSSMPRVVRVGTHALTSGSRTRLWQRLRQHRGTLSCGGNHRGSIFRLLAGEAMINRDPSFGIESWGKGSSANRAVRKLEREHESRVSDYLGNMEVLFVSVPDAPGPGSERGVIEQGSIALLSSYLTPSPDTPAPDWRGSHSGRELVRKSGLWNNKHVNEQPAPGFLNVLERAVKQTTGF